MLTPTLKVGNETYVAVSELKARLKVLIEVAEAEALYARRTLKRLSDTDPSRQAMLQAMAREHATIEAYKQATTMIARYENRSSIDLRA